MYHPSIKKQIRGRQFLWKLRSALKCAWTEFIYKKIKRQSRDGASFCAPASWQLEANAGTLNNMRKKHRSSDPQLCGVQRSARVSAWRYGRLATWRIRPGLSEGLSSAVSRRLGTAGGNNTSAGTNHHDPIIPTPSSYRSDQKFAFRWVGHPSARSFSSLELPFGDLPWALPPMHSIATSRASIFLFSGKELVWRLQWCHDHVQGRHACMHATFHLVKVGSAHAFVSCKGKCTLGIPTVDFGSPECRWHLSLKVCCRPAATRYSYLALTISEHAGQTFLI